MKSGKATRGQLRKHNRQLLLRAVYSGLANSRAALAQETGLAKPTVSALIGELIDEGLLIEEGFGQSSEGGGKRPRLLKFVPDARHVIGISVNSDKIVGLLTNLNGDVVVKHYVEIGGCRGDAVVELLKRVINGLMAQLDAPLLCLGVGVPGVVGSDDGIVHYAPHLGWDEFPLAEVLSAHYHVPVHVANSTGLAAMAQFAFGDVGDAHSLATVLVGSSVGVGFVLDDAAYHGGGELGYLRVADDNRLGDFLDWPSVRRRALSLRRKFQSRLLPTDDISYLHIRWAAANGDDASLAIYDELAGHLARIFAWVIALLRPDHVSLAGSITNLGEPLLQKAVSKTRELVLPGLLSRVSFSLADSSNLVAMGAVARSLRLELGLV